MRRRGRLNLPLWLVTGTLLVAGIFLARGFINRSRHKEPPANAFYEVKRGDLLISVTEEGALRALNETVVRSSLEGYNRIIHLAPEGAMVKKGDLLVELDSSAVRNTLNEQELVYQDKLFFLLQAREYLRIQQSMAESQIKDGELRVENAQADLEKYRDGDAPLLIRTAQARIRVLEEQVRVATERSARTAVLFKNGNATKSEIEADSLTLKREQLGLGQYQEDLRLIQKFDHPNKLRLLESTVQQAQEELVRLKSRSSNENAQAEADLKTSQKTLDVLDETLKQQRRRLENSKIFAPQDGIVVYSTSSPFQGGDFGRDETRPRIREGALARIGEIGGFQGGGGGRRGRGRGGGLGENNSGAGGSFSGNRISSGSSSAGSTLSLASSAQGSSSGTAGANSTSGTGASGAAGAGGSGTGATSGQDSTGGNSSANSGSANAGGQRSGSAAPSFTTFASLRPSSLAPASSSAKGTGTGGGLGSSASASSSGNLSGSGLNSGGQSQVFGSSSGGQRNFQRGGYFDGGFFDFSSGSGIIEEGTMVRQRQELIRLPDLSRMLAEVKIQENRIRQIHQGMLAYVQVETLPGRRFKATVRRVALLPDTQSSWLNPDSKVYATDILIDDELPLLKPGVSARTEIIITNRVQVLSVPIQSVTSFNGENVCFAKRGHKVTPVPVVTGWFNDQFIEVTSGLRAGDKVLLAPISDDDIFGTGATSPGDTNAAATDE